MTSPEPHFADTDPRDPDQSNVSQEPAPDNDEDSE